MATLSIHAQDFTQLGIAPASYDFHFRLFRADLDGITSIKQWTVTTDTEGNATTEIPDSEVGNALVVTPKLPGLDQAFFSGYPSGAVTLSVLFQQYRVDPKSLAPSTAGQAEWDRVLAQVVALAADAAESASDAFAAEQVATSQAAQAGSSASQAGQSAASALGHKNAAKISEDAARDSEVAAQQSVVDAPLAVAAAVQAQNIPAQADSAVDDALNTSDRIPQAGEAGSFRVMDNSGAVALKIDSSGNMSAYGDQYLGGATKRSDGSSEKASLYESAWRIVDSSNHVAIEVRQDGKVFIGDPVFGREILTPVSRLIIPIIIGQSNGEGRAQPFNARLDPVDSRMAMWDWATQSIKPATVPLSSQQQMTGASVLTFVAREMLKEVGPETRLLLLNAAAGGSGLVTDVTPQGCWGVDYAGTNPKLYSIFIAELAKVRAAAAIKYPGVRPEFWIYWHQGEADSQEAAYATALDLLINSVRTYLADQTIPFTIGGVVPENMATPAQGIRRAQMGAQTRLQYVAHADGIVNGGGSASVTDTVHYFREGAERLGKDMFIASKRATNNIVSSVPHKPLDVSATFIQGTLTAKWSAPWCRYTSFVVEYSIDGGAWVAATRTIATELSQVVTGLTGTVVRVRVSTANEVGTTIPTTPITALGV